MNKKKEKCCRIKMAAYYNELGLLLMLIVANHVNGATYHHYHLILIDCQLHEELFSMAASF